MFTSQSLYGCAPNTPVGAGTETPTQRMGMGSGDLSTGLRGLLDPKNPLTVFAAVLLVTVGAASAAGSVRLGKAKVSASVGS
jgi:hypothetical protein